jgi:long-chain fatty acid transport protein
MKTRLVALISLGTAALWSGTALGAGYAFWEQGGAATGRAGAVVAGVNDPSMGFYNPAGLADLGGTRLSIGGTWTIPLGGYTNADGQTFDRSLRPIFPPHLHLYHSVKDKWALGISVFNAFGLGIDWKCSTPSAAGDFPGCARIDRVDLKTPTIQPTFSWRLSKEFSLGLGVSITFASAELFRSAFVNPFPSGNVLLGADGAVGVGGNVGFLFTPMSNVRFGLHYRSAMSLSFDGKADFTFDPSIPAAVRANFPSDQKGSIDLTTPHVLAAGIGWDITPNVTLELDWLHYWWSAFDELRLKFRADVAAGQVPVPGNCTPAGAAAGEQHVCTPRGWMDVSQFRLGVEWRASPAFTLRGGYIFDMTPVPSRNVDPVLPDNHRHDFSIGIGYQFANAFRLDFAYLLVYFVPRDVVDDPTLFFPGETAAGRYESVAHLLALSLGFAF